MSPGNNVVFDASALLIVLRRQPLGEQFTPYLGKGIMSAVNLAEVVTVLARRGLPTASVFPDVCNILYEIRPVDVEQARLMTALDEKTKASGLSVGDRACLALGLSTGLPVLTANPLWAELNLGISIEVLRSSLGSS